MENELQPHLEHAQKDLATALDEACGVDLKEANTDELIRIEEALAMATKAAKQVVSIRLKRRQRRGAAGAAKQGEPTERVQGPPVDLTPSIKQRVFDDIRGKRWLVFAVYPSMSTIERQALPQSYRDGWLSFEAADEKRRVAPIPAGWEELPIEELRLLCHRAQRVPKRPSNPMPPPEASSQ